MWMHVSLIASPPSPTGGLPGVPTDRWCLEAQVLTPKRKLSARGGGRKQPRPHRIFESQKTIANHDEKTNFERPPNLRIARIICNPTTIVQFLSGDHTNESQTSPANRNDIVEFECQTHFTIDPENKTNCKCHQREPSLIIDPQQQCEL